MRSAIAVIFAAVAAMLLQTTLLASLSWLPVVPDLLLVLAVYLGLRHPSVSGAVGAFLLGYFVDSFSGTLPGMHAFALTAVYATTHLVARRLWMEGGPLVIGIVFMGGCVREVALLFVTTLVAVGAPPWAEAWRHGLIEAGVAALIAPMVFAAVTWERRTLGLV